MELSPQFSRAVTRPSPRPIRISSEVRNKRGMDAPSKSPQEKLDSRLRHGLITEEEHHVQSTGQLDHPLHPKSGTVVKGSVIKGEIESG